MSAIFGILHLDGQPVEDRLMVQFGRSLVHRGEGEPHLWRSAQVGLGCCHFPTTPEAVNEVVPHVHPASGIVVTFDGRLDDREDLLSALGLQQGPDTLWQDGALLAEAYLRWGERCPEHLLGDFAFAVWDPRQQQLFVARDHFGVKPFCYTMDERRFAFASEPRALLDLPGVSQELDLATVAGYLAEVFDDSDGTAFQAVRRLREGERITINALGVRLDRYYEVDPEQTISVRSDAEYEEAFRDILFRSVRRRLRSSGPVGCMLSGGLDSSAISCVAAEICRVQPAKPLELFSLVYPDVKACDETPYIQAVVRRTGLPWHAIPVHGRRSLEDVYALAERMQEPNVPFGTFANGTVFATATARGTRVVLDGHGGDETVSVGYERLRELIDDRHLATLSYEYLLLARTMPDMQGFRGLLRVLTNVGLAGRIKRRLQLTARQLRRLPPVDANAAAWPSVSERFDHRLLEARNARMKAAQVKARARRRWHHYAVTGTAQSRAFEGLGRLVGSSPVEVRYPMWDKELVEFCLALPSRQKLRHGYTRAIVRRALRDFMPPEITNRRGKTNFLPQATVCLLSLEKKACNALLFNENPPSKESPHAAWLNNILERFFSGQAVSSTDQQALWRNLSLAAWLHVLESGSKERTLSFGRQTKNKPGGELAS